MSLFDGNLGGGGGFGSRIVDRARQDLGRTEQGGNNRGSVVQDLMRGTGHGQGAPWCAGAATNWTNDAAHGALGQNLVRTTASVAEMMGDYRRTGAFSSFNNDLSNVRVGDAVFFRRQGGGHVGIVTANNGSSIGIIEGNVSLGGGNTDGRGGAVDGVHEATWGIAELQQRNIVGFGHNEARYQKASGHQPVEQRTAGQHLGQGQWNHGGSSGAQHVDHASLGSFPSPFGAFFNKSPQGHSKG